MTLQVLENAINILTNFVCAVVICLVSRSVSDRKYADTVLFLRYTAVSGRERGKARDIWNILGNNRPIFLDSRTYVRNGVKYFRSCSSSV